MGFYFHEGRQIKLRNLMMGQDKELPVLRLILEHFYLLGSFLMWCVRKADLDLSGTCSYFCLLPPANAVGGKNDSLEISCLLQ